MVWAMPIRRAPQSPVDASLQNLPNFRNLSRIPMHPETTRITLPPPEPRPPRRARFQFWDWFLVVICTFSVGVWIGWRAGTSQSREPGTAVVSQPPAASDEGEEGDPPVVTAGLVPGVGGSKDEEKAAAVAAGIAAAREAISGGQWDLARKHFEEVREIDPGNPDALASLLLINRRLEEARGTVRIEAEPAGALVRLGDFEEQASPAVFTGVPFGEHELSVRLEGHDPVVRSISVADETPVRITDLKLARSSGQIELVSEPRGAEFKVVRTKESEPVELVEVGKTPAKIERLDPGEYQVFMSVAGFPERSQKVLVEENRNTSVSAVFASGGLNITSDPAGAEVWISEVKPAAKARKAGLTPLSLADLPAGRHQVELRYGDWEPIRRAVEVSAGSTQDLEFEWQRALVTLDSDPAGAEVYLGDRRLGRGQQVTPFQWEFPEGEFQLTARHPKLGEIGARAEVSAGSGSNAVRFRFPYGSVSLETVPPGAAVVSNGKPLGRTPLTLAVVPPGDYTFELSLDRHRAATVSGQVEPGGALNFDATLIHDPTPVASKNFKNSLGREMVWIPHLRGWAGATEVTQAEYEKLGGKNPSYFKAPNHPVDSVTWFDAVKFCESLTANEKAIGAVPPGYRYRLPTDEEWSQLVGKQKLDGAISSLFERQKSTAPVASLAPNEHGLYDMRGNVWEWVNDWYSQTILNRVERDGAFPKREWVGTDRKVLRGGSWNRSSEVDLSVGNRMGANPSSEDRYDVGFRVVLMPD